MYMYIVMHACNMILYFNDRLKYVFNELIINCQQFIDQYKYTQTIHHKNTLVFLMKAEYAI